MNEVAAALDAMFHAPTAPEDPGGVLARAAAMAGCPLRALELRDSQGRTLGVWRSGEVAMNFEIELRAEGNRGAMIAGCAAEELTAAQREQLRQIGLLAVLTVDALRERDADRRRVEQLRRQETQLRRSHEELMQSALEEREQRLAEQERYAQRLEEEVAARSEQLRVALRRAESASRAKSRFLAGMSHEFRTPLTAILGFSDALTRENWGRPRTLEPLAAIDRNGRRLLRLVDDILQTCSLESGSVALQRQAHDARTLIDSALSSARTAAAMKNLPLELGLRDPWPTSITTDAAVLTRALSAVLDNAVKFTQAGGVTVRCGVNRDGPSCLTVEVIDTGPGIPPQAMATLFEAFAPTDTQIGEEASHGAGLGLCNARGLTRLLGGDLTARSETGKGSWFTLSVPVDPVVWSDTGGVTAPTATNTRRVLIVEDAPDTRRLFSLLVSGSGYKTEVAENGRVALELIQAAQGSRPFDVILMDMHMPVMDGYAATRELRRLGLTMPIVAVTASAMAQDRERCLAAGCSDYLAKPVEAAQIIAAIERAINARVAQR